MSQILDELLLEATDAAHVPPPVSKATVVNAADAGLLPIFARTVRGTRLFRRADVELWARQRQLKAACLAGRRIGRAIR